MAYETEEEKKQRMADIFKSMIDSIDLDEKHAGIDAFIDGVAASVVAFRVG